MVNSKELRIGNLVKGLVHLPVGYNHPSLLVTEVVEIREDSVQTTDGYHKYREIGQIELTEEILLKSGGIKTSDNNITFTDTDTSTPEVVIIMEEGRFFLGNNNGDKYSVSIETVHQFQNLFFTLQGREIRMSI